MEVSLVEEAALMVTVDPIHTEREGEQQESVLCSTFFVENIYERQRKDCKIIIILYIPELLTIYMGLIWQHIYI